MHTPRFPLLLLCAVLALAVSPSLHAQFSDEFDQDALDSGWSWLRESPANWRLGSDALTIWTETGALNGTSYNNVRNLLVQPLGDVDRFMIDTEVRFSPYFTLRNAGLVYYFDDDNYIRVSRGIHDGHNDVWMELEVGVETQFIYASAEVGTWNNPVHDCRLRLTREGNQFRASYCLPTGRGTFTDWNSFTAQTISFPSSSPVVIGLQAANGDGIMATTMPTTAVFSYFHYNTETAVTPLRDAALAFSVEATHPMPARSGSVLGMRVTLDRAAPIEWRMVDILGREVIAPQRLGVRERGTHLLTVPTGALRPGIYLWQIGAGSSQATQRVVLTR